MIKEVEFKKQIMLGQKISLTFRISAFCIHIYMLNFCFQVIDVNIMYDQQANRSRGIVANYNYKALISSYCLIFHLILRLETVIN